MQKYNIDVLSIKFNEFSNSHYAKEVTLAPSFLIVKDGKIVTFLKADSDEDLDRYQDPEKFEEWLQKYINLEKAS